MGSSYSGNCRSYSCIEAEGCIYEGQVVVYGLRHTYNGNLQTSSLDFFSDVIGTPKRSVSTDGNENIDVLALQSIYNLFHFLSAAAGRTEDGASLFLYIVYDIRSQIDHRPWRVLQEPQVSERNTCDSPHAISIPETSDYTSDDVVQSRADSSTGTDGRMYVGRIKIYLFSRAGKLQHIFLILGTVGFVMIYVEVYFICILHIICASITMDRGHPDGVIDFGFSNSFDYKFLLNHLYPP